MAEIIEAAENTDKARRERYKSAQGNKKWDQISLGFQSARSKLVKTLSLRGPDKPAQVPVPRDQPLIICPTTA
jgi:hypothetical protein